MYTVWWLCCKKSCMACKCPDFWSLKTMCSAVCSTYTLTHGCRTAGLHADPQLCLGLTWIKAVHHTLCCIQYYSCLLSLICDQTSWLAEATEHVLQTQCKSCLFRPGCPEHLNRASATWYRCCCCKVVDWDKCFYRTQWRLR